VPILKVALATLVTNEAVKWVVGQKEFHDTVTEQLVSRNN
jgi:hypothetical protein